MKHFLVADEVGNPIYFDHPDGRMQCLPLATSQSMLTELVHEHFRSITCGNTKFIFQQVLYFNLQFDALSFLVTSDQGEPESFLRSQLDVLHDLLVQIPLIQGHVLW